MTHEKAREIMEAYREVKYAGEDVNDIKNAKEKDLIPIVISYIKRHEADSPLIIEVYSKMLSEAESRLKELENALAAL